jgi:AcrR family transcriptional regulator
VNDVAKPKKANKTSSGEVASGSREPLTSERIVEAALELMDRDGMAALTMRKLGTHLSVQAMSLYGYYPNKASLLAAASSTLFGKIQNPDPGSDPIDGLRQVMVSFYSLVEKHPSIVDLLFAGPSVPTLAVRGDADRAALVAAGFSEEAPYALQSLTSFVIGALHQRRQVTPEARHKSFEFGLDMMLSGLRQEAARRAKAAKTSG